MAALTLNLYVNASKDVEAYWIDIDDEIVPVSNGKGSKQLQSPGTYRLGWHFVGNPGGTLAIVGKVDDNKVVEAKGTVPDGDTEAFGSQRFVLP